MLPGERGARNILSLRDGDEKKIERERSRMI